MTRLPLALAPLDDESWGSYLTRQAAQHQTTLACLGTHLGLRGRRGHWPGRFGVEMASENIERVAPILGLPMARIAEMQLTKFDQLAFDLGGLTESNAIAATRATTHSSWVWLAGSAFCPSCLIEDEGAWRTRWRIPWITTCQQHQVGLLGSCQHCGGVPGLGNSLHASAPPRVNVAPDGRLCSHTQPSKEVCGADLSAQMAVGAAPGTLRRAQLMTQIINDGPSEFAGRRGTPLQVLRGWQATIGIAVGLGVVDVGAWGRTHRWANPPRDPKLIDDLLEAAEPIATARDTTTAADLLGEWLQTAGIRSPHVNTFDRITQPSAALRPVIDQVLSRHGRAHTMIQRQLITPQAGSIMEVTWGVGDVPQLVWPCALPDHLRNSTCPDQRILRAVVAMILVRMRTGATSWVEAGSALGFPPENSRNWTRYSFSSRFGIKKELIESADHLARQISDQPQRSAWWRRKDVDGYGTSSLEGAQSPNCGSGKSCWCPCLANVSGDA